MKNLLIILLSFFIFVGCGPKSEVVVPKDSVVKPKDPIVQPIPVIIEPTPQEPIIEEVLIEDDNLNRIAIIYPSRIVGKYAKSTISTISAFLIYNDQPFQIQTFDTYDENPDNIIRELVDLNEKGFTKVIALFTQNGFDILNSLEESRQANIYFPLINKNEIVTENENFIFGGISYQDQLALLQSLSNGRNTMFYKKGGYTENKLKDIYFNTFSNTGIIKEIQRKQNNYRSIMKDKRMVGNTILLNTYPVKSAIILSQLTAFEIYPAKVLSTQINYNPILVKLTQSRDRKNLYIANSIGKVDDFIEDYTKLLGSDITYNWVDYSSLVGVNYLLYNNESEIIRTQVIDNQVNYEPTLYKSTSYGFEEVFSN
ncbi:hypothetical protein [Arcobacter sp. LA11]|uniref:hypothetical protein n=1 Tax=Arcobacter sp. LA11 TaxID=1898176 RepID=UPI0009324B52|nr:hypothetical protein [Arcobacter sp. LA11]